MSLRIPRRTYVDHYGPTVGDRLRLADTELIIEVERDHTVKAMRSNSAAARSFATAWGNPPRRRAPKGCPTW